MALKFYWMSGSPFAWRAMLALEFKGLKYESQRLDPAKGEHKTPEFLAINPRGKVPVLQDGKFTVYESLAIINYLEHKQPEPNLLGSNAPEAAAIWQRICELDNYTAPPIMDLVRPILFGSGSLELSDIEESVAAAHSELKSLDQHLSGSSYLVAERPTAADIVFLPILQYLIRANVKQQVSPDDFGFLPLGSRYGNIAAWLKRVESTPGYDDAYPPHWRD